MTVRIRETPYQTSSGTTYQVRRDEVRGHLMIIASGGTSDLEPSFGDQPDSSTADYSVVLYAPSPAPDNSTPAGWVRERLKTMVDESGNYDIIGVPGNTIWSDGANVEARPAFALGNTIFYDTSSCNGDGRWIRGTNGDEECTPSAVILFHEMAHGFHDHGAGDWATEEAEAVDDENHLREALGLVPRDRNRLEGGCGCDDGSCCIVASVACGSPNAAEINALRRLRDYTLRASRLGSALFDEIHREYYGFSIDVCRIMVTDERALRDVDTWLVRPLVGTLASVAEYTRHPEDPARAGRILLRTVEQSRGALAARGANWNGVRLLLEALTTGVSPGHSAANLGPGTQAVCDVLARALPATPHVRWAIMRPIRMHAAAASRFDENSDPLEVGRWIAVETMQWLGEMPIETIAAGVPQHDLSAQIAALAASVFTAAEHRLELTTTLRHRAGPPQNLES